MKRFSKICAFLLLASPARLLVAEPTLANSYEEAAHEIEIHVVPKTVANDSLHFVLTNKGSHILFIDPKAFLDPEISYSISFGNTGLGVGSGYGRGGSSACCGTYPPTIYVAPKIKTITLNPGAHYEFQVTRKTILKRLAPAGQKAAAAPGNNCIINLDFYHALVSYDQMPPDPDLSNSRLSASYFTFK
jgi:hypothetical protein